ncbi:Ldh family oxidoreductase [Roseibium marinum]|uniref:LDH2 family malate/lactate/ureidoglycolate dehydrogenase n=1 Tax=Roseibium marinum TaxID=281252 RepID=A0A2S3V0T3_9HYPH|nr:Ldh family oxidoreductase [Roseibium marinum]POF33566.1 LDH2 family malate/lactate/ureidoglycolate dehydrogenase [Roseibium marinum]
MSSTAPVSETEAQCIALEDLSAFSISVLSAAGANLETASAATRAMLHGSRLGIDSHGIRLLPHYAKAIRGGRVNGRPRLDFNYRAGVVATLNAGDAHGALAAYEAMKEAISIARFNGMGAVAIQRGSHFGPAGAYAVEAARAGMIGVTFCNSDAFVRLHGGAERFHGTNPIAVAAPSGSDDPWLLDMATSSIPYNRIRLFESLGQPLPRSVASLADGEDTLDAAQAVMLAPLGGEFGFKGAGLAGLVEIFSAVLTGMKLSSEILPMEGEDMSTPRYMGAFVMAIDPAAFLDPAEFKNGMRRYLHSLRNSPTAAGETVLAPGDREWAEAARRDREGIPIDPKTELAFRDLAEAYGVPFPEGTGTP